MYTSHLLLVQVLDMENCLRNGVALTEGVIFLVLEDYSGLAGHT